MAERLQKIIAQAGLASRRKAERMILEGRVTVNGRTVRVLGSQADPEEDSVKVDGRRIKAEPRDYWAVHKPRGVLSAASDPKGRRVITDLVRSSRRLYPAGRLDFQSEGLMILTNDGELARRVTKAGSLEKVYRVKVRGVPQQTELRILRKGARLRGVHYAPCRIRFLKKDANSWLEVRLRQGKNRQIRRMFEAIDHPVMRLRRTAVGPVQLGDLAPGATRRLTSDEVRLLKEP